MEETLIRVARFIDEKRFGKFRATVVDNKDPQKRGRLRLRIPSVLADQQTDWALPCTPYGGLQGQGMFMIPDVDAQVWAEFEEGDINRAIWVGTFWQQESDVPEDAAKEEPTTRMLQTASGHILQFDDKEGEERFRLFHPADAVMEIDKDGTVSLTDASGGKLTMDAASSKIVLEDANGNTLTMDSAGTKIEDASGNVVEMTASGITVDAPKVLVKASQVLLGGEGGEPVIKGQTFLGLFASHVHTVAPAVGGPTSPPIPQGEASSLSTVVMST
jgi:uncharacterized protein involved in type VI secretion and phage assembly